MHPDEVAKILIKRLKESGIHILYYRSMSSDSHYLKLDGGVAHSVRISDHHSLKKHLIYKYNLITVGESGYRAWITKDRRRGIYGIDAIDKMISHILNNWKLKKLQFGGTYKEYVRQGIYRCRTHEKLRMFKEI